MPELMRGFNRRLEIPFKPGLMAAQSMDSSLAHHHLSAPFFSKEEDINYLAQIKP
jgi:hypothetical protein